MGKATIEEFGVAVDGRGVADAAGAAITNVTTSATADNTTLASGTRIVEIFAEDTNIRVDVGIGVTADANSRLVFSGSSFARELPFPRGSQTWRVSIINA